MASHFKPIRQQFRDQLVNLTNWIKRRPFVYKITKWVLRRAPKLNDTLARERMLVAAIHAPVANPETVQNGPPEKQGERLTAASTHTDRVHHLLLRALNPPRNH